MTTLSELLRLQQEATPGPWEWSSYGYGTTPPKIGEDVYSESGKIVSCSDPYGYKTEEAAQNQKNAAFIAAARNFDFSGLQQKHENEIFAAQNVSRIYFEIAAEAVGEEKARAMFDERFEALRASLDTKARGDE